MAGDKCKNHSILASEYLLIGATIWKPYTCPKMTHHILITLIPLIAVMALGGTFVSIIRLVFWIKEKHKKNRTTTSVPKRVTQNWFSTRTTTMLSLFELLKLNKTQTSLTTETMPISKWKISFSHHNYTKHLNLCTTSGILTHVFDICNTQTLPANSLGLAGSWWKLGNVVPVVIFTTGGE